MSALLKRLQAGEVGRVEGGVLAAPAADQQAPGAECEQQCDPQSCGDCTPSVSSVIRATGKTLVNVPMMKTCVDQAWPGARQVEAKMAV